MAVLHYRDAVVTPAAFRTRIHALGLTARGFARILGALAGCAPPFRTVERWVADREPPTPAVALLAALERYPELRQGESRHHAPT